MHRRWLLWPALLCATSSPLLIELATYRWLDPFTVITQSQIWANAVIICACALAPSLVLRSWRARFASSITLTAALVAFGQLGNANSLIARTLNVSPFTARWIIGSAALVVFTAFSGYILYRMQRLALCMAPLGLVVAGAVVLSEPPTQYGTPSGHPPDILLVVMDTTRADHLSLYGYSRMTTPEIDRIARDAVVYERAMSPAGWTPPGHASLFTGLLPSEHGTAGDYNQFAPPHAPLAEILRDAGYCTAAIVNNPKLDPSMGWDRGFQFYHTTWSAPPLTVPRILHKWRKRQPGWPWVGSTGRTIDMAKRWWRGHSDHPRFLFLNLIDPHSPYGESHAYRDIFLTPRTRAAEDISHLSEDYDAGVAEASGAALDRIIARYDGDIRYMDAQLGRFFDWLASRAQLDSTVIALTSDHGERLGEQGRLGHQLGVDHVLLHVPLILRHPPSLAPSRINDLVHTHGLYRTLLRIAHVDAENPDPSPIEPLSAQQTRHTVALMRHQGKYIHTLYEVNKSFDPRPYAGHRMTAFDGRWKLTRSTAGFIHLYDIEQDPGEENDLSSRHSEVVDTLTPVLDRLPAFDRGSRTEDIPEDTRQLLEALGYVE